jgi:hypothetical protein
MFLARPQKRDDDGGNVSAVVDPETGKIRLQLTVWEQIL